MVNQPISQQQAASVRPAVIVVMQALPDRKRDPQEVVEAALAAVSEPERSNVRPAIARLVKLSPRCWGIHRRRQYWTFVFQFLSLPEALKYYLRQFPNNLTDDQRHQMARYLKTVFHLNDGEAVMALSPFGTRPGRRRKPAGCYGWI